MAPRRHVHCTMVPECCRSSAGAPEALPGSAKETRSHHETRPRAGIGSRLVVGHLRWADVCSVPAAFATVIRVDDPVFGSDSVLAELGPGGDFEGWAVASESDLEDLRVSAGIVHSSADPEIVAAAEQLRDWFCISGMLSCVNLSSRHEYARGLLSDPGPFPARCLPTRSVAASTWRPTKRTCAFPAGACRTSPRKRFS
jgi:hypothetical protein